MKRIAIVGLAMLPLTGMAATFDAQLAQVIPLCEQLFFPNSQAMDAGVDVDAELRKIEKQLNARAARFHTRDGMSYLKQRLATEQDDVAQACIQRILDTAPVSAGKSGGK